MVSMKNNYETNIIHYLVLDKKKNHEWKKLKCFE